MCRAQPSDPQGKQCSVYDLPTTFANGDPPDTTYESKAVSVPDSGGSCSDVRCQRHTLHPNRLPLTFQPYGEEDFRKHSHTDGLRIGLCAGLIRFWARERSQGRDPIERLRRPDPSLVRAVIIYQLQSMYFKTPLNDLRSLTPSKNALIVFKYGSVSAFEELLLKRQSQSMLELDLAIQHGMPIIRQWHLTGKLSELVAAFGTSPCPGLYLLLIRYWVAKKNVSGEEGHRTAILIDDAGVCRFYDSRRGELTFHSFHAFLPWFMDYWQAEQWEYFLHRGIPPNPPLRLVHLGATHWSSEDPSTSPEDISTSSLPTLDDLKQWLTHDLAYDITAVLHRSVGR